jgi:hypothetical protein
LGSLFQKVLFGAKIGWFLENFSSNREDSWRDGTPMANGFLPTLFSRDLFVILENKEI